MSNCELLAPAGSLKVLKAAVNTGADAVYFGLRSFSARSSAVNFSHEEAEKGFDYLHLRGKKGYVTLNTLLKNSEIPEFLDEVRFLASVGCDGVIVQDWGAAELIRNAAPELPVHGSTQMSVHNLPGTQFLYEKGIERVVLARELTFDEIKYIKENTDCEIEMFIHGALCVCYSGQCYMSSFIGERSGNRGKCAQPCRLRYSMEGREGTLLSPLDIESTSFIKRIKECGIHSLKIEGRLKNEYYTAVVVDSYRKLLDGGVLSKEDKKLLFGIFNRGGYTSYLDGRKTNMFCFDKNENPYSEAEKLAEDKYKKITEDESIPSECIKYIDIRGVFRIGETPVLFGECEGKKVKVNGDDKVAEAKSAPLTEEKIISALSKTGGTNFMTGNVELELDEGAFMPASSLNELRRRLLSGFSGKREIKYLEPEITPSRRKPEKTELIIKVINEEQYKWAMNKEYIVLAPAKLVSEKGIINPEKTGITLPAIIKDGEISKYREYISKCAEMGVRYGCASNISHFELLSGFEIITDGRLNIANSKAESFLPETAIEGVSRELNLKETAGISPDKKIAVTAYGYVEMMITENCIKKNVCGKCIDKTSRLKDRTGKSFPVLCAEECRNIILNPVPLIMSDKMKDLFYAGADYGILEFTVESEAECEKVLNAFMEGINPCKEFTRGHFYRGVN